MMSRKSSSSNAAIKKILNQKGEFFSTLADLINDPKIALIKVEYRRDAVNITEILDNDCSYTLRFDFKCQRRMLFKKVKHAVKRQHKPCIITKTSNWPYPSWAQSIVIILEPYFNHWREKTNIIFYWSRWEHIKKYKYKIILFVSPHNFKFNLLHLKRFDYIRWLPILKRSIERFEENHSIDRGARYNLRMTTLNKLFGKKIGDEKLFFEFCE